MCDDCGLCSSAHWQAGLKIVVGAVQVVPRHRIMWRLWQSLAAYVILCGTWFLEGTAGAEAEQHSVRNKLDVMASYC